MSTSYQTTDRSSANFTAIFDAAIGEFQALTKEDLGTHPFAVALGNSSSPESVLDVFRTQAQSFNRFREGNDKLMTWLTRIIHVVLTLSGTFDRIGVVSPLPLCDILSFMSIFSAILPRKTSLYWYWRSSRGQSLPTSRGVFTLYSSQAVRDVVASYEVLANLFERIQFFLQRLDHYTAVTLTPDMMELLAKIMAQILSILALSTKIMKERKISGFISPTFSFLSNCCTRKNYEEDSGKDGSCGGRAQTIGYADQRGESNDGSENLGGRPGRQRQCHGDQGTHMRYRSKCNCY